MITAVLTEDTKQESEIPFRARITVGIPEHLEPHRMANLEAIQMEYREHVTGIAMEVSRQFPGTIERVQDGVGTIEVVATQSTVESITALTQGRVIGTQEIWKD